MYRHFIQVLCLTVFVGVGQVWVPAATVSAQTASADSTWDGGDIPLTIVESPPTVLVLVSVDHTGRVRDAKVLPSVPEPTTAQKALALEYVRTIRFAGMKDDGKFHPFEVPVTIYVVYGTPKER